MANEFKVLITDVTHMNGDRLCVAGWDMDTKKLVRPLLPKRQHWIAMHKIVVGNIVVFTRIDGVALTSDNPHKAEDVLVAEKYEIQDTTYNDEEIHDEVKTSLMDSPSEYFQFELGEQYTRPKTLCQSLGGIKISATNLNFYEKSWNGEIPQLRGRFNASNRNYNFSVTSVQVRKIWDEVGVSELNNLVKKYKNLHLRLGLARAWAQSGAPPGSEKCYCQLNGVLFLK